MIQRKEGALGARTGWMVREDHACGGAASGRELPGVEGLLREGDRCMTHQENAPRTSWKRNPSASDYRTSRGGPEKKYSLKEKGGRDFTKRRIGLAEPRKLREERDR